MFCSAALVLTRETKEAPKRSARPKSLRGLPSSSQRGLVGSDDASAATDEVAQLLALLVGERGDVGKDESLEAADVVGREGAVVHHLKGNAGFDESLIEAELRVFDETMSICGAGV